MSLVRYLVVGVGLLGVVLLLVLAVRHCHRTGGVCERPPPTPPSTDSLTSPWVLARVKAHLDTFVTRLRDRHPQDPRTQRLYRRYQHTQVFESDTTETYTLNKGEKIVMCLRNSANQQVHDDFNLLVFVGLHELGHIMSETTHHTEEFWTNFRFLLRNAAEMDLYDPIDYSLDPVAYCAMVVSDNPYFYERTREDFVQKMQQILLPA